jgi:hypothetical protein
MEILTASIIDAGCEKLRQEEGLVANTGAKNHQAGTRCLTWQLACGVVSALGTAFVLGLLVGRGSLSKR